MIKKSKGEKTWKASMKNMQTEERESYMKECVNLREKRDWHDFLEVKIKN